MTSHSDNHYSDDALRVPAYFQDAPFHPFNPENHGIVDDAQQVVGIPLPFGRLPGEGPYPPGATGWNQFDKKCQTTRYFQTLLQLMSAALEVPSGGTPHFDGRAGGRNVRDAMLAYIRRVDHREKRTDRMFASMTKDQAYFDRDWADVLWGILGGFFDYRIEKPGNYNNPNQQQLDDGAIMDGLDLGGPGMGVGGGGGGNPRRNGGHRRRRGGGGGGGDDDEAEEAGDDDGGGGGPPRDPYEKTDEDIRSVLDDMLKDCEGTRIMDKVKIIITNFRRPSAADPLNDDAEDAGCIVWFVVMDPLFSFGKAIRCMIEWCEEYHDAKRGIASQAVMALQQQQQERGPYPGMRPGGGGGGAGGFRLSNCKLLKTFPWLTDQDHKSNALHDITMNSYLELVAFALNRPSLLKTERAKWLARGLDDPGSKDSKNIIHPLNVFTAEWCLSVMREYGVPDDKCRPDKFQWQDGVGEGAKTIFRFPSTRSYQWSREGWVWNRNGYAGLCKQYMPWVKVPKALLQITSVRNEDNALTVYRQNVGGMFGDFMREMMMDGIGMKVPLPLMPYDPNALRKHNAILVVARENKELMGKLMCPENAQFSPTAYAEYCTMISEYREACLSRMRQILVPEGHISPPMKKIMEYMGTKVTQVGWQLNMFTMNPDDEDPIMLEMDPFAHYMAKEAMEVKHGRLIAADVRHWQMTHYGAQDCHSMTSDMHYSAIYHGLSQSSKSFTTKDATLKVCITGTVEPLLESSTRSWNVNEDYVGMIILKDEMESFFVNSKAAAKDTSGNVERFKSMITEHELNYRVLVFVEQGNGKSKRESENVHSLFHASIIGNTNEPENRSDEAFGSRFLNFTMTRADCNLWDYLGVKERTTDLDRKINDERVHQWRTMQGLIAIMQALIESRVIPEPSMDVFDAVQSKILQYMDTFGMDTRQIRSTQMIRRLARIYVILNALLMIYDIPGAIHAGKPFDLGQLLDTIPYLYCTKQIAIFAITQSGEIYLHPMRSIVLKGALRAANFPYVEGYTIEQYFKEDTAKSIKWRQITKRTGSVDEGTFMDFNYVGIAGKYKEVVLKSVADLCKPRVGVNEVDSELAAATNFFISVNQVHTVSKLIYDSMPGGEPTRERAKTRIPVVRRDFQNDYVYIAVEALDYITENLLLEAIKTCLHDGCVPQVMLTGMHENRKHPDEDKAVEGLKMHYNSLYKTLEVTPYMIAINKESQSFSVPDVMYIPPVVAQMMGKPTSHIERTNRTSSLIKITQDLDDYGQQLHHYRSGCPGSHVDSPARQTTIMHNIREYILENHSRLVQVDMAAATGTGKSQASTPTSGGAQYVESKRAYNVTVRVLYPDEAMDQFDEAHFRSSSSKNFLRSQDRRDALYKKELAAWKGLPKAIQQNVPAPMEPRDIMVKNGHIDHLLYGIAPGVSRDDMTKAEAIRNAYLAAPRDEHWTTKKRRELQQHKERQQEERRQRQHQATKDPIASDSEIDRFQERTSNYDVFHKLRRQTAVMVSMQELVQEARSSSSSRVQILDENGMEVEQPPEDVDGARGGGGGEEGGLAGDKPMMFEDGFVVFLSHSECEEYGKKIGSRKRTERGDPGDGDDVGQHHDHQQQQHIVLMDENTNSSSIGGGGSLEMVEVMGDDETTRHARYSASGSSSSSSHDVFGMLSKGTSIHHRHQDQGHQQQQQKQQKVIMGKRKKTKKTRTARQDTNALIDDVLDQDE